MRRSLLGTALSLLLIVPVAAVEVDSLLVASVGGPAAVDSLRGMTSYTAEGVVTLNGLPGRFTEYFVPPDRSYVRLDLETFTMVQAYDGLTAWQQDLNGQVSELAGYEKQEILKAMYFHSFSYLFPIVSPAVTNISATRLWPTETAGGSHSIPCTQTLSQPTMIPGLHS